LIQRRYWPRAHTRPPPPQGSQRDAPPLAAEPVQGAALALERVDDVHGGDRLAARVLGVGDGVADDVLEEDLEHAARLLVDEAGDALDAAPPGQPPDRRLGDALDVVTEHLAVALGAALAQPLAALAAPRHRRPLHARARRNFGRIWGTLIWILCCVWDWGE
jgi:hypothetical protein